MEKVCRWIPFVFWEICLSDEKCSYEVVYGRVLLKFKKAVSCLGSRKKGRSFIMLYAFRHKKTPQDAALFEGQSLDYAASSCCSSSTASSFFAFFGAGLRFAPIA